MRALGILALLSLNSCGPERFLFGGFNEETQSTKSIVPLGAEGYQTGDVASDEGDCSSPKYAGKTCYDENTLRFSFDTAKTALAPPPGAAAKALKILINGDVVTAGDDCLSPVADAAAAAAEPGALLAVVFDAPVNPESNTSNGTVGSEPAPGKSLSISAFFKYACAAAKVTVVVETPFAQPDNAVVHLNFRSAAGTVAAASAPFSATGANDGSRDVGLTSVEASAVTASCQGTSDPLTACYDEKVLQFSVDLAGTGAFAPSPAAGASASLSIGAESITALDSCLATSAGPHDPGRLTISFDAASDVDGSALPARSLSASFYYSCDVKTLAIALSAHQALGERYQLNAVFAAASSGFTVSTPVFRASGVTDGARAVAFAAAHAWK